jgi:CelD/BcsL family acetyltransferase involved in cellulose biosynthesis
MNRLRLITDPAGLAALWPAWEALWRRCPHAWPFAAPAWLRPWWAAFGTAHPHVAVLETASGLAGILPLYRLGETLLPLGVGITDYCDLLLAPDAPPDAAAALLAAALAGTDAPRCDLPDLPPASPLRALPPPPGWRAETWDGPPCPVLRLTPVPAIPRGMRRDLRQARHRADRTGGWQVTRTTAGTLAAALDHLGALHAARWRERGEAGVLADPAVARFHRQAAPALLAAGALRLEVLSLRARPAAAILALLAPGRIGFYLAGLDPAARFESPGTLLLGHMIETAAAEGRHTAHFLRGGEPYKFAWGGDDSHNQGRGFRRA